MLNGCLNFKQLVKFIANEFDEQKRYDSEEHIRQCEKCHKELDFVKQFMDSASENGQAKPQPSAGGHISEELQERYFQHTLSEPEIDLVHAHVSHCAECFEVFSFICSLALADVSSEEQSILDRIEAAKVTDRLKPYKEKFITPKKRTVPTRQPAPARLGLTPAWRYSFALVVISIIGYFGYQQYDNQRIIAGAKQTFSSLVETHLISDGEFRPTGDFVFDPVGATRDVPIQQNELLEVAPLLKAVESNPDNAKLNHYLATAYFFSDDMENAERYYKKALELDPANAKIYNDLALIDMYRDLKDAAIENLQNAVALNPELPEAQYNLAVVLELNGDKAKSIEAWQRYIKLDPNSGWNKVAQKHLLDLK